MKNKKIYFSSILVILFIINTYLAMSGATAFIDDAVYQFVITLLYSDVSSKVMNVFTFLGSTNWIVGLTACFFVYFLFRKKPKKAISTAVIIAFSTLVNNVVKFIVKRPRPEYMMINEKTFSYPSGHSMAAATLYSFFIYLILNSKMSKGYKCLFSVLLGLLILAVGTSRIYFGAHFFTDVFGAVILSLLIVNTFAIINDKKKLV